MDATSTELIDWVMAVGPDGTNEGQRTSLPTLRVVLPEWGVQQSYVVESPADVGAAIKHGASRWLESMPTASTDTSSETEIRLRLLQHPEVHGRAMWIQGEGVRIVFDDASFVSVEQFGDSGSLNPIQDELPDVDVGVALLEPITPNEYGLVERMLAVLWQEAGNGSLTDAQERQVLAIAAMIESQHRDAEPGVTPRWKLIGPISSGARYLVKELPKDALAWWKLYDLMAEAGWTNSLPLP